MTCMTSFFWGQLIDFISLKSLVQSRGGNMMSRFRQGVRSTIASPQNIREKYRNRKTWIGSFAYLLFCKISKFHISSLLSAYFKMFFFKQKCVSFMQETKDT